MNYRKIASSAAIVAALVVGSACGEDEAPKVAVSADEAPSVREGLDLLNAGKSDEALGVFEKIIAAKDDDGSGLAYYNAGVILQGKGDLEKAESYYRQAIALEPTLNEAYYNLGVVLRTKGDAEAALAQFATVMTVAGMPVDLRVSALTNTAELKAAKGDTKGAQAAYDEAVSLSPAVSVPPEYA